MAAMNNTSNTSAPLAPHAAQLDRTRATAHASSAAGSSHTSAGAKDFGAPNSVSDLREPAASATFATPATPNTAASARRAISNRTFTNPITPLPHYPITPLPHYPITRSPDSPITSFTLLTLGQAHIVDPDRPGDLAIE